MDCIHFRVLFISTFHEENKSSRVTDAINSIQNRAIFFFVRPLSVFAWGKIIFFVVCHYVIKFILYVELLLHER